MTKPTTSPFRDLREALGRGVAADVAALDDGPVVRSDPGRWSRTGIPEVVHAGAKPTVAIVAALRELAGAQGRALASRVRADDVAAIREELAPDFAVEHDEVARCLVALTPGACRPVMGGVVGLLSAGSSDIPVASEAALMAREMGAGVVHAWDAGVAGLHRLVEPLECFAAEHVDVIIVAAGMDGALPSVVAGLVDVPVIGLPTSIGYGFGGEGVGALTAMLQSCAPGLVVVNIDNGIGAGATAALIANRAARSWTDRRVEPGGDGVDGGLGG